MSEYHVKLLTIVTEYDRRQSKKASYNRYALGHYCAAIDNVEQALADGAPIETALKRGFCGSLLRHVARKLGLKHEYHKWE